MKTKTKIFLSILIVSLFLISCNKDHQEPVVLEQSVTEESVDEVIELGSVSINAFIKDVIEVTTGRPFELETLLDEMVVQITDDPYYTEPFGVGYVFNSNYRDITEPISLEPGSYSLLISNYSFSTQRFDSAVHGALSEVFSITAGSNTPLDLELGLLDVAATINFSSEVVAAYPDISARVEYLHGGPGLVPNLIWTTADNARTGYLNTYVGDFGFEYFYVTTGTLNLEITATGPTGTPVTVTKTYVDATANQHYNITIEQGAPTTASLNVTLGDENVIEDTVPFPY